MIDYLPLLLSILKFWDRVSHWTSILPTQRGWFAGQTPMTLFVSAPQCGIMDTQSHNPILFCLLCSGGGSGGGGRSRDRIFCHPGHPWTPIFFPPTPMGLEHRHCFQHDYWQIFKVTVCQGWGLLVQWKNTQPALKINCLIPSTDCGIKDYETCSNKRKRLYTKYVHGNKTNISPLVGFFLIILNSRI